MAAELIKQEFESLPAEVKAFLTGDEHKANLASIFEKLGGNVTREKFAQVKATYAALALKDASDELKAKLQVSDAQKDAIWAALSGGAETLNLEQFIKGANGILIHAIANGVDPSKLKDIGAQWKETL